MPRKPSRLRVMSSVFLHFASLTGFGGCFGRKMQFLAQNCVDLGRHLPTWRLRPEPPPVSWGPELRIRVEPEVLGGKYGPNGNTKCCCCCLFLLLLLLFLLLLLLFLLLLFLSLASF